MAPEGKVLKSMCPTSLSPLNRHLFPVGLGLYIFAVINLSHEYNLLLSLVSPFAKSVKLRGGWPSDIPDIKGLVQCLASSTHPIYASYGIYWPCWMWQGTDLTVLEYRLGLQDFVCFSEPCSWKWAGITSHQWGKLENLTPRFSPGLPALLIPSGTVPCEENG